ncbi:MAG: hypothetical protein ACTHM8_04585 [Sphingomonas sp.]
MKLLALVSAGLVATAALAPVSTANAMPRHGWRWKTVCRTTWHHHHRVRRCHRVRVRW